MKTPIQELKDFIAEHKILIPVAVKMRILNLREKERQLIIDAYRKGGEDILNDTSPLNEVFYESAEDWYNETFNHAK